MTVYPHSAAETHVLRHELLATLFVGAAVAVYLLATTGTMFGSLSTRMLGAAVLTLGFAACIANYEGMMSAFTPGRNAPLLLYVAVASIGGALALATGIGTMITGSERMLDVLVPTIVALWLLATVRHASAATRE
jgi:hypothetical protein